MAALQIYTDDLQISKAILGRDGQVTREFIYNRCYPLFKSIFDNYHTDCTTVIEFINEMFLLILTPSKETGRCQLENYRGESTLATWLKTACLFYCYHKYKRKKHIPLVEFKNDTNDGENSSSSDRLLDRSCSTTMDFTSMNINDIEIIISSMSNERYRQIIRLRYLERMTNEETAEALGMTMANYYNKHKLAKAQFAAALGKEEYT